MTGKPDTSSDSVTISTPIWLERKEYERRVIDDPRKLRVDIHSSFVAAQYAELRAKQALRAQIVEHRLRKKQSEDCHELEMREQEERHQHEIENLKASHRLKVQELKDYLDIYKEQTIPELVGYFTLSMDANPIDLYV